MTEWATVWPALLTGLSSLLGVAAGSGVAYLTNKQSQDRQDARSRRDMLLGRLDRIHSALAEVDDCHRVLHGELLSRFGINKPLETGNLKKNPIEPARFLIAAFLSGGRPLLEEIDAEFRHYGELFGRAVDRELSDEERGKLMVQTLENGKRFEDSLSLLREKLYQAAKEVQFI